MVLLRITLPGLVIASLLAGRSEAGAPRCAGEYAEDLSALSAQARKIETETAPYSYAVRTGATYECVSYGSDGALKKSRTQVRASGTAFGYRHDGGGTLLLTNEHVAAWPAVTDAEHDVDGVPSGCKRIAETLKIVDDDKDTYEADDIPLTAVAVDPALDVAILRSATPLQIIPWQVGRSAALTERNTVQVKGFPLGAFRATNVGKVVSAHDHDVESGRDHDDFVVDALLTGGGSGSPVLAVSCKTGAFELVGIFHARYKAASALNVVVAIDQVREMMATLKPTARPDRMLSLDATARTRLREAVRSAPDLAFFSAGPLVARVHVRGDDTLVFTVFAADFPITTTPVLAIEDLVTADAASFGTQGAIYIGDTSGLHPLAATSDPEVQAMIDRTLVALRRSALAAFDYREAVQTADGSRRAFDLLSDRKRTLERARSAVREIAAPIVEMSGREAAKATGTALRLTDVESGPVAPVAPASSISG